MKKIIAGLVLLITLSTPAMAAVFNETTSPRLDTAFPTSGSNRHVDTVNGLEWLDFGDSTNSNPANNVSFGYSINNIVAGYAVDGFRLASQFEVTELFNFFFTDFVDSGNGTMTITEDPASTLIQERNSWLVGFGTDKPIGNGTITSDIFGSRGWYEDDNGAVQVAGFTLDMGQDVPVTTLYSTDYTLASSFGFDRDTAYSNIGVFMVREYVPAVPIPAAVWLFASGLIGLVAVARRKV